MDGKSESELFDTNFCRCRIVESVGEGVTDMKEGDHVVPIFNGECGDCIYCKREKTNMCERSGVNPFKSVMVNDGKSRFSTKDGKPIFHFLNTSTFSEYTVLESACVVKVEPEVPLKKMTLLSCGVSTGKDLLIACMYILALYSSSHVPWTSHHCFPHEIPTVQTRKTPFSGLQVFLRPFLQDEARSI